MKIVVTGGAGFIGSNLAKYFMMIMKFWLWINLEVMKFLAMEI